MVPVFMRSMGTLANKFIFGSAGFSPPNKLPLSPHAFLLGLFLTRVSQVRMWVSIE
jgi:hypothetical protein